MTSCRWGLESTNQPEGLTPPPRAGAMGRPIPTCGPPSPTRVICLCPARAAVEPVDQERPHRVGPGNAVPSYTASVRSTRVSHE